MTSTRSLLNGVSILLLLCATPLTAPAIVCPAKVGNEADDGLGTLRHALAVANDGDILNFCPSLSNKVITLTSGPLNVTKSVTILGLGANLSPINGNGSNLVFSISPGVNVNIVGLTISNGFGNNGPAAIYNEQANLTVSNCVITGNHGSSGAAIYNDGAAGLSVVRIVNSTISSNSADFYGGALLNDGAGPGGNAVIQVLNSTISGNFAQAVGGAIYNSGFGGGTATVSIVNSTLSGNHANTSGSALYNNGAAGITATVNIGSTILNSNGMVNSGGAITSLGYNLSSDDGGGFLTAASDKTNTNPLLGPLNLNGGTTPTHALTSSSPAIDAGTNLMAFATDQPGGARTINISGIADASDGTDIGAYELQAAAPVFASASRAFFPINVSNAFKIVATGYPAPALSVTGTMPAGVNLNSNIISGTPPAGAIGNYLLKFIASNSIAPLATQYFTLAVVDPARPDFHTSGPGWLLNGDAVNGGPAITNDVFTLTDASSGENRSGWFYTPLYIGGFQASFTYQDIGGNGADGCAFVVQNDPRGTTALGYPGGGLAYSDITPSVGVLLNIYGGALGGPSGWMLGTNGIGAIDFFGNPSGRPYQPTAPVNLDAGNPVAVRLRYAGEVLQLSLTDIVTSNVFQTNILVDIPSFVGTNAAWIGITGSEGGVLSHQIVSAFSYRPLPTLSISQGPANTLVFNWPVTVYGFSLQSNTNLSNVSGWSSVAATFLQTNNLNQVSIPASIGTWFYRLSLP